MSLLKKASMLPLALALGCSDYVSQREGIELSLWVDFNRNGVYDVKEDVGHVDNEEINFANNYVKVRLLYHGREGVVNLSLLDGFPHKVLGDFEFQVKNGENRLADNSEFLVKLNQKLLMPGSYTLVAKPLDRETSYSQRIKSAYTPNFFEQKEIQDKWFKEREEKK